MTQLVVFDIDGTLTQTMELDSRLYVQAVTEALGIDGFSVEWHTYRHVTDEGVAAELIDRHCGGEEKRARIDALRDRFVTLIDETLRADPSLCRPVPGAVELLTLLQTHPRFECAVATGAWREAAMIKTRCAGIDVEAFPLATTEDGVEREAIVETAVERAKTRYGLPPNGSAAAPILVGDGVWDLEASRRLGYGFLGIGQGESVTLLLEAGARDVIADFTNTGSVMGLLAELSDSA